jgi:hypothetical protein
MATYDRWLSRMGGLHRFGKAHRADNMIPILGMIREIYPCEP